MTHSIVAIEHLGGNIPYIVSAIVPAQMDHARLFRDGRLRRMKTMDENLDEAALLSREELPIYAATETDRMRCHAWLRMQGASFFLVHFTQVEPPQAPEQSWQTSFGDVVGEVPASGGNVEPPLTLPASSEVSASIVREYRPRVIPSKENWIAAQKEIEEREKEEGRRRREMFEQEGIPDPMEGNPVAWRSHKGEDGWDS